MRQTDFSRAAYNEADGFLSGTMRSDSGRLLARRFPMDKMNSNETEQFPGPVSDPPTLEQCEALREWLKAHPLPTPKYEPPPKKNQKQAD
jgi:hypothetical protein